jgi:hypothetical protein
MEPLTLLATLRGVTLGNYSSIHFIICLTWQKSSVIGGMPASL